MDERTKAIDSAVRNFASVWQSVSAAYDAGKEAGRAAVSIDRTAWMPVPIEPRPTCCDRGASQNCCQGGCQQDKDEEMARTAWAEFDAGLGA